MEGEQLLRRRNSDMGSSLSLPPRGPLSVDKKGRLCHTQIYTKDKNNISGAKYIPFEIDMESTRWPTSGIKGFE